MKGTTATFGFLAGAMACIVLTGCDSGQNKSAAGVASAISQQLNAIGTATSNPSAPASQAPQGSDSPVTGQPRQDPTASVGTTGNDDGSGNQDGSGPGNGNGSGPGNGDGSGPGNGDGSGPGNGDGSGPGNGNGPGNGDTDSPSSEPNSSSDTNPVDGIPSIDQADVTCQQQSDGSWVPYLTYVVSDTTGLEVNLNSQGTEDQGGYHNLETSYTGTTGSVAMPYTGCYVEYGEHIYRLRVQGHYEDNDLTEEQFELGEKTITMTGIYHDPNAPMPKPRIDEYLLTCTLNSGSGLYDMTLTYAVANADGMALSIDNPGVVGSFGTYGPAGTIDIPNLGCYAENGEQTYDLYTTGGTGPQAVVSLTRTGEHTYPGSTPTTTDQPTTTGTADFPLDVTRTKMPVLTVEPTVPSFQLPTNIDPTFELPLTPGS